MCNLKVRDWETEAEIWTYLEDSDQRMRLTQDMERPGQIRRL